MITKLNLISNYTQIFNEKPKYTFFAPGRINLIGEHTDYNGGHVFPAAISLGIYAAVGPRDDDQLWAFSQNLAEKGCLKTSLSDLRFDEKADWLNYFRGMTFFFAQKGIHLSHGFNLYIQADLPASSGLSSSAAMSMLAAKIIMTLTKKTLDPLDVVKMGQRVENDYLGYHTGIMDEFAIMFGRHDQAIFLDTNKLDYHYFPLKLTDHAILIMNTNKPRNLITSKYNERQEECQKALTRLQQKLNIKNLCDLTPEQLDENAYLIDDDRLLKRAKHVIWENARTITAKKAMTDGDLSRFGRLMNASHVSLKYDYDVTGPELDTLVETAWQQKGVLGARMTGAGFGGCALALVETDAVSDLKAAIRDAYVKRIGYEPSFYLTHLSDGPQIW